MKCGYVRMTPRAPQKKVWALSSLTYGDPQHIHQPHVSVDCLLFCVGQADCGVLVLAGWRRYGFLWRLMGTVRLSNTVLSLD